MTLHPRQPKLSFLTRMVMPTVTTFSCKIKIARNDLLEKLRNTEYLTYVVDSAILKHYTSGTLIFQYPWTFSEDGESFEFEIKYNDKYHAAVNGQFKKSSLCFTITPTMTEYVLTRIDSIYEMYLWYRHTKKLNTAIKTAISNNMLV